MAKSQHMEQTDSIAALATFWDSHDVTDFEDELVEISEQVFERLSGAVIQMELPEKECVALQSDSKENITANQLVDELNALGVYFLAGGNEFPAQKRLNPLSLMSALAASDEARLRLALIPLLLQYPDYAAYASVAGQRGSSQGQIVLKCYYTAAWLLQQKYRAQLEVLWGATPPLPDLFSTELGLPTSDSPDAGLRNLADRQRVLSGTAINWLGTYEHALQRLIRHEVQARVHLQSWSSSKIE